jgi:hypothetical protein
VKLEKYNPRKDMPTWKAIKEYWLQTSIFQLKGIKDNSINFCFACTRNFHNIKLERAHIHALWAGGNNSVENLHLLCGACHIDSENFGFGFEDENRHYIDFDQSIYWQWFFDRNPSKARFSEYMKSSACFEAGAHLHYTEIDFILKFIDTFRHDSEKMKILFKCMDQNGLDDELLNDFLNSWSGFTSQLIGDLKIYHFQE